MIFFYLDYVMFLLRPSASFRLRFAALAFQSMQANARVFASESERLCSPSLGLASRSSIASASAISTPTFGPQKS